MCINVQSKKARIHFYTIQKSIWKKLLKKRVPAWKVCYTAATPYMWKQRNCEHCWQKSQNENVVLCGPRQRSPVAWVNEVISRDGVSCHTSGTGFRIQSPSQASITGPPRQLTCRSNIVYSKLSKSKTVVLRVISFMDISVKWDISS